MKAKLATEYSVFAEVFEEERRVFYGIILQAVTFGDIC